MFEKIKTKMEAKLCDEIARSKYAKENEELRAKVFALEHWGEKLHKDCNRGFPITESEMNDIKAWKEKHLAETHGLSTEEDRIAASGAIGGDEYRFISTSIGVIGSYICPICHKEFTFQELS